MSFQDDLDFDPSDDDEDGPLEVTEGYGIHVTFHCGRIDCNDTFVMAVDESSLLGNSKTLHFQMPDNWGYDRHDGINAALHCSKHRQPPTEVEIAEINARLAPVSGAAQAREGFEQTTVPFHGMLGKIITAINCDDTYNGQCSSVMVATRDGSWMVVQPEIRLTADNRKAEARLQVTTDS